MRIVDGVFERICLIVFALVLLQAPQFFILYTERLGGHLSEIAYQKSRVQEHAASSIEFKPYLAELEKREQKLLTSYRNLSQSSSFLRPFRFFQGLDPAIAWETARSFQPGLPLTLEAILWGLCGAVLGSSLYLGARRMSQSVLRR